VHSILLIFTFQIAAHEHRMISAGEAHFKNMDDINQVFLKAFYPAYARYGECGILSFVTIYSILTKSYLALSKLTIILWTKELQK
jgi:hypothetical protein